MALPALHLVARAFPRAQRLLMTNFPVHAKAPAASAILNGSGLVDGYINYPVGTRSVRELARIWWSIRRFRPDVLVYLAAFRGAESAQRDAKFFRFCGIRNIVGLPVGDLAENLYDSARDVWEREAARLLRCVRALGESDVNDLRNWDLRLTAAELRKAAEVLAPIGGKPIIACGPGTKMQAKDWGQDNWRALMEKLSDDAPGHALVLVGAKEDAAASEYAGAAWRGPVVNLCGKLTPRETAAVLRNAELFLGPDSGPMHLAAAYGVRCAIAFAARDLRGKWFPAGKGNRVVYHKVECAGCKLEVCTEKKKVCLTSISVDEMQTAAREAWERTGAGRAGLIA